MTVKKISFGHFIEFCANRCIDYTGSSQRSSERGYRTATYIATICGHDTMLCKQCAKEWREIWDSALGSTGEIDHTDGRFIRKREGVAA